MINKKTYASFLLAISFQVGDLCFWSRLSHTAANFMICVVGEGPRRRKLDAVPMAVANPAGQICARNAYSHTSILLLYILALNYDQHLNTCFHGCCHNFYQSAVIHRLQRLFITSTEISVRKKKHMFYQSIKIKLFELFVRPCYLTFLSKVETTQSSLIFIFIRTLNRSLVIRKGFYFSADVKFCNRYLCMWLYDESTHIAICIQNRPCAHDQTICHVMMTFT